jgi:hypothetical protein
VERSKVDRAARRRRLLERIRALRRTTAPGLSELIGGLTDGAGDSMTIGQIADRFAARGLVPFVLLMAILNGFAVIPGLSTILGLPVIFLGLSLIAGARRVWLPARLRGRAIPVAVLNGAVAKVLPLVARIERAVRPRWWPGDWPGAEATMQRLYGAVVLLAGVVIVLPVPFGNILPSITLILISVGFIGRDGIWALAGLAFGALAAALLGGLVIGVIDVARGAVFG